MRTLHCSCRISSTGSERVRGSPVRRPHARVVCAGPCDRCAVAATGSTGSGFTTERRRRPSLHQLSERLARGSCSAKCLGIDERLLRKLGLFHNLRAGLIRSLRVLKPSCGGRIRSCRAGMMRCDEFLDAINPTHATTPVRTVRALHCRCSYCDRVRFGSACHCAQHQSKTQGDCCGAFAGRAGHRRAHVPVSVHRSSV